MNCSECPPIGPHPDTSCENYPGCIERIKASGTERLDRLARRGSLWEPPPVRPIRKRYVRTMLAIIGGAIGLFCGGFAIWGLVQ